MNYIAIITKPNGKQQPAVMQNMKSKESVESVIRTYYKHNEDYKWSEEDIKIEVFDPSETLFCRRRRIND